MTDQNVTVPQVYTKKHLNATTAQICTHLALDAMSQTASNARTRYTYHPISAWPAVRSVKDAQTTFNVCNAKSVMFTQNRNTVVFRQPFLTVVAS